MQFAEEQLVEKKNHPDFKAGDTVTVNYRIVEGAKKEYNLIKESLYNEQEQLLRKHLPLEKFRVVLVSKEYSLLTLLSLITLS